MFAGLVDLAGGLAPGNLLLAPQAQVTIETGGTVGLTGSTVDPVAVENALAGANLTLTAGSGITVASPVTWATASALTLNSGGTIAVNAPISQAAPSGTTGGISLIAGSDITIGANIIGTGGAVNVLANADTSGKRGGITVGNLALGSAVTVAATGNITLGGGVASNGSGYAVGDANSYNAIGIAVLTATTIAAAGTVTMRGQGGTTGADYGISILSGAISGGSVTLSGTSGTSASGAFGVILGNYGYLPTGAARTVQVAATTGNLSIDAYAAASGTTGLGNSKNALALLSDVTLAATSGSIFLTGTNASTRSGAAGGVSLSGGDIIVAANTIGIWGSATAGTPVAVTLGGALAVTGQNSEIDLIGDRISNGAIVSAPGTVKIAPVDAWLVNLGTTDKSAANTLELSAAELQAITAGTLTIGSASAAGLTVSGAVALSSVNNLNLVTGGNLSINAPLELYVPAGTAGTISLAAGNDVYITSDISGTGGTVNLVVASDTSGQGGGITTGGFSATPAQVLAGNLTQTGTPAVIDVTGDITFGGGAGGTGYAVGLNSFSGVGVAVAYNTSIVAGGTVTMRGRGSTGSQSDYGVDILDALVIGSSVTLSGLSNTIGVLIADQARITQVVASSGNVTMTGAPSTPGSTSGEGVLIANNGTVETPYGSISLTGTGGTGVETRAGSFIVAANTVAVTGSATSSSLIGVVLSGTIDNGGSAAAVVLTGDRMFLQGLIASTGQVSIQPLTSGNGINLGTNDKSAASTLELSASELQAITAGTLAIGTATSGSLVVSGPVTLSSVGNLTLTTGGDLTTEGALGLTTQSGTNGLIALIAGGGIDIGASINGTGGTVSLLANANTNPASGRGGITIGGFSGTPAQITSNDLALQTGAPVIIDVTGNITLGGGAAADGSGYALGLTSLGKVGIAVMTNASIEADGTVTLRGQGSNGTNSYGIDLFNGTIAGSSVILDGVAGNGTYNAFGLLIGDEYYTDQVSGAAYNPVIFARTGDLTLIGNAATATASPIQFGTFINANAILAAPFGSVSVQGTSSAGEAIIMIASSAIIAGQTIGLWGSVLTSSPLALDLGGALSTSGAISLTGDRIAIGGDIVTPSSVSIQPLTPNTNINLGTTDKAAASTLELSAAEIRGISAGTLSIGSATSGSLNVTEPLILTTAGNLSLTTGGELTISQPVSLAIPAGTTGGISLIAGQDIYILNGIAGTGGTVNLLANANTSGTGGGIDTGSFAGTPAQFASESQYYSGVPVLIDVTGNATFAGGTAGNGSGYAVGLNTWFQQGASFMSGTTIIAGGTLTVRGQGSGSGTAPYGIDIFDASLTGGSVALFGAAAPAGGQSIGVMIADFAQTSFIGATNGNVTINGSLTAAPATSGAWGVLINNYGTVAAPEGSIVITGTGLIGIEPRALAILAARDTIDLTGVGTNPAALGLNMGITFEALGPHTEVDLTADPMVMGGAISTPGLVSIQPVTPGTEINLGTSDKTAAGTLELSAAELTGISAGTLAIGSAGSGSLTVSGSLGFTSVGTLDLTTGGVLSVAEPISLSTAAGVVGGISLIAGADIYLGGDILGGGGTVNLLANADTSGGGGGITVGGVAGSPSTFPFGGGSYTYVPTLFEVSGNLTFGGGTLGNGSGYAVGLNSVWGMGIDLAPATTIVAGGAVTMRGAGTAGSTFGFGVDLFGATVTGASVTLSGLTVPTGSTPVGVVIADSNTFTSVTATTGNVTITGGPTAPPGSATQSIGVRIDSYGTISAPSGSVILTGTGGTGILAQSQSTITAGQTIALTGSATSASGLGLNLAGAIGGGAATIDLTGDRIAIAGPVATTGLVSIQPLTAGTNINLGTTDKTAASTLELSAADLAMISAGTLAIGSGASGGLTESSALGFTTVNTLDLTGGTTLTLSAPLTLTTPAGIGGGISLTAGADIYLASNIIGSGGSVDLMVNSNTSGSGGGIQFGAYSGSIGQLVAGNDIEANQSYLISATGNITLGGGPAGNGSGYAVGLNTYFGEGINFFNYATIIAGGTVTMRGQGGSAASGYPYGINMWFGTIDAGSISLNGLSGANATGIGIGVLLADGNTLIARTGNIAITGDESTVTANLTSNAGGVQIYGGTTLFAPDGSVSIHGTGGGSGSGGGIGVAIESGAFILAGQTISVWGSSAAGLPLAVSSQGMLGSPGSAVEIDISGDRVALSGPVATTGLVSIQPVTPGWTINLGTTDKTAASTLELSAQDLQSITAGTLTVGSAAAGDLTVSAPIALTSVGTLDLVTGGALTIASPLGLTAAAGTTGGISLIAGSDIYIENSITGSGGTVNLLANANASGFGGGITTGGFTGTPADIAAGNPTLTGGSAKIDVTGNLTFGGGKAGDGSGYAVGLYSYAQMGIAILPGSTLIAGGSVVLRGQAADTTYAFGVDVIGSGITGRDVTIQGLTDPSSPNPIGVLIADQGQPASVTATAGNVTLTGGPLGTASNGSVGVLIANYGTVAAPHGSINVSGTGQVGVGTAPLALVTASGSISMTGTGPAGTSIGVELEGTIGSAASTAEIDLVGNQLMLGGPIVTAGLVSITPASQGAGINLGTTDKTATATLELSAAELAMINAGTLFIGATGTGPAASGTAGVHGIVATGSAAVAPVGSVTPAGTIVLSANITASGTGTLILDGPGGVIQTGGTLSATQLQLTGATISLPSAGNAIGTLTGSTTGNLSVTNGGALTVGAAGISAGGTVALGSPGIVTLAGVVAAGGSGDALTIDGGGLVNNAGPAALDATGSGARWLVFAPTATAIIANGLSANNWFGTSFADWSGGATPGPGNRFVIAHTETLTVTPSDLATTYGTAAAAPTFSFSGLAAGDSLAAAVGGTPAFTGLATNAGTYTLTALPGSLTSPENYTLNYGTGTLTVGKAALTVATQNLATTYGQVQSFTVAYSGFEYTDTASSLGGTLGFTGQNINAGTYAVTASGLTSANYTIGYTPGTLTVAKAPLTVTTNNLTTVYGQPQPLTVSYAGFQYTDTAASLGGTPAFSGQGTNAGTYSVLPSGLTAANYAIGYTAGTLTVTPASLTVQANSFSKNEGVTYSFAGTKFTASGLLGTDTVTTASFVSAGTAAGASPKGSPYTITASAAVGTGLSNYVISYLPGLMTVIAPASAPTTFAQSTAALSQPGLTPAIPTVQSSTAPVQTASLTPAQQSASQAPGPSGPTQTDVPALPAPTRASSNAPSQPVQAAPAGVGVTLAPAAPSTPAPAPAPAPAPDATAPAAPSQQAMLTPTSGPDGSPAPAPAPAAVPEASPVQSGLASGDTDAIGAASQAAAANAPESIGQPAAASAVSSRTSELIARGASPQKAVEGAARAVAQLGAAATRSGPPTRAQSLGDTLASSGSVPKNTSPSLATGLAHGLSPEAALARANAAARQEAFMEAASKVPTGPGDTAATALGNGAIPPDAPNQAAFALALATGKSPEAAWAASATAAKTLNDMHTRGTLPETPAGQAGSALSEGDPAGLANVAGDSAGQAAMVATLAHGGSLNEAVAAARQASANRADQDARSAVTLTNRQARDAALAQGQVPADTDGGKDDSRQLAAAAVAAEPDAMALAEGRAPDSTATNDVTARLLANTSSPEALKRVLADWAKAQQRDIDAAQATGLNAKATLIQRLAQGRVSQEDIDLIIQQARTSSMSGIVQWLRSPQNNIDATPSATRQGDPAGRGG